MKPHIHAELIKAWADGHKIEYYLQDLCIWVEEANPMWVPDREYRIKKEETYSIGGIFTNNCGFYILSLIGIDNGYTVTLINVYTGNQWAPPCKVKNPRKITKEEFDLISMHNDDMVLVKDAKVTVDV